MSEQKFPPRVWIWFYEDNHASKRKGIREAHKCTPHGGKLQPEPTHISIQEHQHLMAENERRIEKLRKALNKLTEEMQVFLNVSLKHHFPDAREAQANAIAALQEETK